jgi:hypothetical protein
MEPEKHEDAPCFSIVLLLREPHAYDKEELRLAAQKAWGAPFQTEPGDGNLVIGSGPRIIMKAGRHFLTFPSAAQPYSDDPQQISELLPLGQRRLWMQHRAWIALDYMKGGNDRILEYGVLARLAAEMLTDNCVGIFLPESGDFLPNDASLDAALRRIAAEQDTGLGSQDAR